MGNQLFVMPAKPNNELFAHHLNNNNNNNNDENDENVDENNNINNKNDNFIGQGMLLFDDVIATSSNEEMKKIHNESLKYAHIILPEAPSIKLEYPNPFSDDADPSLFTEIDRKVVRRTSIKPSVGDNNNNNNNNNNNKAIQISKNELSRQQSQRVLISSISTRDNRGATSAPGSFEIILSTAAKESGLWTVNSVIVSSTGIEIILFSIFIYFN